MIIRLWSLTLLVTQLVLAYDHKIELERCKEPTDTVCIIRESCFTDKSNVDDTDFPTWKKTLVEFKDDVEKLQNKDCDVVLQMKMLSMQMFHVMMQIKAKTGEKLKKEDGLKLDQGVTQFHCKDGQDPIGRAGLDPKNEGTQVFGDALIFCSFTVKLSGMEMVTALNGLLTNKAPSFVYSNTNDPLTFAGVGSAMWMLMTATWSRCDHSSITSPKKTSGTDTVLKEMNTLSSPPFTCSSGSLVVSGSAPEKADSVFCDKANGVWMKEASGKTALSGTFSIYCEEKLCRQCPDKPPPIPDCTNCDSAVLEDGGQDACLTLKCNGEKKWTLTGQTVIEGTAECKPKGADPAKFAWYLKDTELDKAVDCGKRFEKEKYPTVPEGCPGVNCKINGLKSNDLSCIDDSYEMKLLPGDKVVSELTCDFLTGKFRTKGDDAELNVNSIDCVAKSKGGNGEKDPAGASSAGFMQEHGIAVGVGGTAFVLLGIAAVIVIIWWKKKKKKAAAAAAAAKTQKSAKKTEKTEGDKTSKTNTASSISSVAPDVVVDSSEGGKKKSTSRKSKGSKREEKKKEEKKEKKFYLEDYQTWDNEQFNKKILPNFKNCEPESQTKWVRNCMGRFYAYCNTKKTPESGTFQQFWLLVKKCADDKCENAGVWEELFRIEFMMAYSVKEKTDELDHFRLLSIKPFETYMSEYLKKCGFYREKNEPRPVTEMRVMCILILIHTRHPDVVDVLRTLTFNEKLEVPLRMLTAACYTRERDDFKGPQVQQIYVKTLDNYTPDPHAGEGWGTFLQNCIFGLGGFLITVKEVYQTYLFEAIYQFPAQKSETEIRRFSPTDWLYAYKGACLHENSAKVAMDMFMKLNNGCLMHIDCLLKQKFEDPNDRSKARDQYKRDMKEYTLLLSTLVVGEKEFLEFQPHLRFVILFVGEQAKIEEPLDEDRIRERAINVGNMARDRTWAKESCTALYAIGAKLDK